MQTNRWCLFIESWFRVWVCVCGCVRMCVVWCGYALSVKVHKTVSLQVVRPERVNFSPEIESFLFSEGWLHTLGFETHGSISGIKFYVRHETTNFFLMLLSRVMWHGSVLFSWNKSIWQKFNNFYRHFFSIFFFTDFSHQDSIFN